MKNKTGRAETNVSLAQDATNNHKCITCSECHKQPQILHVTWGLTITPTLGLLQHLLLKPHQQFSYPWLIPSQTCSSFPYKIQPVILDNNMPVTAMTPLK
jgi:hypothetical protein